MQWTSAISERFDVRDALTEVVAATKSGLGPEPPDLVIVFVSPHHAPDYETIPGIVYDALTPKHLIGCSGGGVIGAGTEVEERTGFSLTAARLPDVDVTPFHVETTSLPDLDAGPTAWEDLTKVKASASPQFVVLADPFTLQAEHLLSGLDYTYPKGVKIGGLASGGNQPGQNVLFLDNSSYKQGAVGLSLTGNIRIDPIVAQGCRPIGRPVVVTACKENLLTGLDDRTPMDVLREVFETVDDRDRQLISSALHLGVVTDPLLDEPGPGDFLMRNVLGLHQESEGLYVGELLREGQVVQFHVRDAHTAADDLEAMLKRYGEDSKGSRAAGALLFSCLGRGKNLFGKPDHDTGLFLDAIGPTPLGGFFCNGEIGPVGSTTYLHGFTSSFGIFRPRDAS